MSRDDKNALTVVLSALEGIIGVWLLHIGLYNGVGWLILVGSVTAVIGICLMILHGQ